MISKHGKIGRTVSMNRLETKIGKLKMSVPTMTSAGTSGCGNEILEIGKLNIDFLGAFVTKSITLNKMDGNPHVRIVEVPGGILNSIGLQNKGVKHFIENDLPNLQAFNIPVIINTSAESIEDFCILHHILMLHENTFDALEINLSCPNVKWGLLPPASVKRYIWVVRNMFKDKTIIAKLSPNVTDIISYATAAIEGGADALSMINTVKGMAIDIDTQRPILGNVCGGLSGPCIKSIGIHKVYECFKNIPECNNKKIPIIGIGGIMNYKDVLEYILAGASAVGIGTGFIINPLIFEEINDKLNKYLIKEDKKITDLIGAVRRS